MCSSDLNAVNQQIKKLAFDTGGDLKKMPDKIDKFLKDQPTLAGKVFTTEQRYQLKTLSDNLRTIYGSAKPNEQKDNLALRALELSSKAMGLGQAKAATVVVEANHLDNLAKRLVALRPRNTPQGEVYEAEAKEVHSPRGH